jgi:hypothetical protein
MFGYGFGLSDIRVTLGDGSEVDCLQKIYPVARWVAAGFSGSVKIGFRPDRQSEPVGQSSQRVLRYGASRTGAGIAGFRAKDI